MELVVTTGAIMRAKFQSNHRQQTNIQLFTGRMFFQTNSVKALVGKKRIQSSVLNISRSVSFGSGYFCFVAIFDVFISG